MVQSDIGARRSGAAFIESLAVTLADILQLDAANINQDASFRELGLSSSEGMRWLQVLGVKYKISISISRLYDHPTLRSLGEYLSAALEPHADRVDGDRPGAGGRPGSAELGGRAASAADA